MAEGKARGGNEMMVSYPPAGVLKETGFGANVAYTVVLSDELLVGKSVGSSYNSLLNVFE